MRGAGQAGGASTDLRSGSSGGRHRQPAPSQCCCCGGRILWVAPVSNPPMQITWEGGCLEQPVRERPAVCLQIEVFSPSLRQPDWLLHEKEAFS